MDRRIKCDLKLIISLLLVCCMISTNIIKIKAIDRAKAYESVSVSYDVNQQKYGWYNDYCKWPWSKEGQCAGETGANYRLEGMKVKVSNNKDYTGSVKYLAYVQGYGWQKEYRTNGNVAGTTGQSKRMEAIKIQLTDELKEKYDVYYRVYAQTYGWLDWAKNGETAGTQGYSKNLQGIRIVLVDKGEDAPGDTGLASIDSSHGLKYRTHVQTYGWQGYNTNGQLSGTTGKSKRLEAINIKLANQSYVGDIEYKTHIQTYGWEDSFKKNGDTSGTSGKSKRLEAIQIRLTEEMAEHYNIFYRVHAQHYGWLGWAKNGENAGTAGYSYRLEGIEILIIPKGDIAPTSSAKPFYQKTQPKDTTGWDLNALTASKTSVKINNSISLNTSTKNDKIVNYYFVAKNNTTGTVSTISEYSNNNVIEWTPTVSGNYTVTVYAKDSEGNIKTTSKTINVSHGAITYDQAYFSAHRGYQYKKPENSLASFKYSASIKGVWAIDTDIIETKDGKFVCNHDYNLYDGYGVNKNITESNYNDIKNVVAVKGNGISSCKKSDLVLPTLEEYLTICKENNKVVQMEMKYFHSADAVERFINIVKSYGFEEEDIYIHSLDCLELQKARSLFKDINLVYCNIDAYYVDINWLKNEKIGISADYRSITDSVIKKYRDNGIEIYAFTVDDATSVGQLIDRGIRYITSNTDAYMTK